MTVEKSIIASPREEAWLWAVLTLALGFRVILALGTDISFDEAYFWTWSQRLSASYLEHPPLIAWAVALLGVRGASLALGALTVLSAYVIARKLHQSHLSGLRAAALFSVTPAAVLAGVFATPDTPLILFWPLAAYALHRKAWVTAGIAFGFCLLSKYTAVLLPVSFLLWALWERQWPRGALLSAVLAGLLFSPVVYWNATHDWVGFLFQWKHGTGASTGGLSSFVEFLGGQLAMAGPVLGVLAAIWVFRGDASLRFFRLATLVPLLVFGLLSLKTRGEANWPAVAWLTACIGMPRQTSRWLNAALAAGLILIGAGALYLVNPWHLTGRETILKRTHGFRELESLKGAPVQAVFTPNYQLASEVAYYAKLPVTVEGPHRQCQFDLLPRPSLALGSSALWVSEMEAPPEELLVRFDSFEGPLEIPAEWKGKTLRTFRIWTLSGHRGSASKP